MYLNKYLLFKDYLLLIFSCKSLIIISKFPLIISIVRNKQRLLVKNKIDLF